MQVRLFMSQTTEMNQAEAGIDSQNRLLPLYVRPSISLSCQQYHTFSVALQIQVKDRYRVMWVQ